ncbi:MAG: LexA family protein [Chloroflexota bacterium]
MIKLTARQQAFWEKLKDLYRERRRPVHYSTVAEGLGVSKFSAYDMLRVLEQKGVAASDYWLSDERGGPGRSQVVFYPTVDEIEQGVAVQTDEDWLRLKQRLLNELREAYRFGYREKLAELLARLPDLRAPLDYCAETIAALVISLNALKGRVTGRSPLRSMSGLLTAGEAGLGALAGLSLGSTLITLGDSLLTERLLDTVHRYQDDLSQLSEENKRRLTDFVREALVLFQRVEAQADVA